MWKIRRKLARWMAGKDATITWRGDAGFLALNYRGKPRVPDAPTWQEQLAEIVDDGTDVAEYDDMIPGNPSDLWRETRKQLMEEKQDDKS